MAIQEVGTNTTMSPADVKELRLLLDHDNSELRAEMLEFFRDPLFKRDYYSGVDVHRKRIDRQLAGLLGKKFARVQDYMSNPLKFFAYLETLIYVDYSLSIKHGVHWTLCGGTIQALGTKKHEAWLDRLNSGAIMGSFAMTELGHGSNVAGIETTATYDVSSSRFIINSPCESAQKCWIGGAAQTAHISTVFAQLTVNKIHRGVHVFLVRLRNDDGTICAGIRIMDNGPKMGLNGVDNGRIWFNDYAVPLDSLLDKYCSVSPSGEYSSPIKNNNLRFATMISGLVAGRVCIGAAAIMASKLGLNIAIRYGHHRKQFGSPKEVPIMSYTTHQRRLFPGLCTTVALCFEMGKCKDLYLAKSPKTMKQADSFGGFCVETLGIVYVPNEVAPVHRLTVSAGNRVDVLHACRDSLGGQGVAAVNWIGPAIADFDVDTTFEGDNVVLLQQISKALLADAQTNLQTNSSSHIVQNVPGYSANLGDLQGLKYLIDYRQRLSLHCYLKKVQALQQKGMSPGNAMNSSHHLGQDCAWGRIEADVFHTFLEVIDKCSATLALGLKEVCLLFATSLVEKHMAFYLQHNLLKTDQADDVADQVNSLCKRLYSSGLALRICDSFGVPEHMLPPIAFADYVNRFAYASKL